MRAKTFVSVAAAVAVAISLARDVAVLPDGSVRLAPDVTLRTLVAAPGWRKSDGKPWAVPTTTVTQRPDGRLDVRAVFEGKRDGSDGLGALGFEIASPRDAVRGRIWRAGLTSGEFLALNTERRLGAGRAQEFQMPLAGGRALSIVSASPLGFYMQDNIPFGVKTVTMRLGDMDAPRSVTNGEQVVYAFTAAIVEPLETPWTRPYRIEAGAQWARLDCRRAILPGSALDFSRFGAHDAPAGRYGWLRAEGEHLVFADRPGRPVRFYGVNLCTKTCFPKDAATAERLVTRLRLQGYNAIRLHHHDAMLTRPPADAPAAASAPTDGVTPDPTMFARLDLLVAAAIRHGMYVTTDMFVSRDVFYRQIGIDRPGKVPMQVYKSLTDLWEPAFRDWAAFSRHFFGHVNPYTGRAYRDEPAMPLISLINEGGLFMGWWYTGKTEEPVIVDAWRKWVTEKRRADPAFHPEVSPDVVPATPYDNGYSGAFAMFQADVEAAGIARRIAFLRSIGVKALLTSDNSGPHWAPLQATTRPLDYIDDHFYQDHPQFVASRWSLPTKAPCRNPVCDKNLQCCTSPYTRMAGKPFTVTEFSFSAPSPWRAQGGLLTGALAGLQDWSGLWHFSHSGLSSLEDNSGGVNFFAVATDPLKLASDRAVLALFMRGDMASLPPERGVSLLITPESVDPQRMGVTAAGKPKRTAGFASAPKWMAEACWKRRTSSCLTPVEAGAATVIPRHRADEPDERRRALAVPADPRVLFDRKAASFTISTPRTAGGFACAGKSFATMPVGTAVAARDKASAPPPVRVAVSGADATVWATSLDDAPLASSARILVTHLTDAQNEGASFKDATYRELYGWGLRPLVRTGTAEVSLAHEDAARCRVWALRLDGSRKHAVPAQVRDGRLVFTARIADPDPTLHYEITR